MMPSGRGLWLAHPPNPSAVVCLAYTANDPNQPIPRWLHTPAFAPDGPPPPSSCWPQPTLPQTPLAIECPGTSECQKHHHPVTDGRGLVTTKPHGRGLRHAKLTDHTVAGSGMRDHTPFPFSLGCCFSLAPLLPFEMTRRRARTCIPCAFCHS